MEMQRHKFPWYRYGENKTFKLKTPIVLLYGVSKQMFRF